MSRIRLSDEIRKPWVPRFVPSGEERASAFVTYKSLLKEFEAAWNSPQEGRASPMFPMHWSEHQHAGRDYARISAVRSMIELANDTDGLSLTLFVTKGQQANISSPYAHRIVFENITTGFPQEVVTGRLGEDAPWNFQRAAIAMAVCESAVAESGRYNGWPGYGPAKQTVRSMPEALKPKDHNRISVGGADGVLLTDFLQRLGEIRLQAREQIIMTSPASMIVRGVAPSLVKT